MSMRLPNTDASLAALELTTAYAGTPLLNHSIRSYLWGAAWARKQELAFDDELFFVASLIHDLGLVEPFNSHTVAFEEAGGHVAAVFAAGAGWSAERRQHANDVIVLHMRDDVEASADPESYLLQVGTSADVSGLRVAEFDPGFVAELVEAYPRDDFRAEFGRLIQEQASLKPGSAAADWVRGGGLDRIGAHPLD